MTMINLADSYARLGRHAEQLKLCEETLARCKATLGRDNSNTLMSMNNLADSYAKLGRHAEALKLNEEALARFKATLGPDHPDTLMSMGNLAENFVALDRPAEAVALIDDFLRRAEGKIVDPRLVPLVLDLRLQAFAQQKSVAGCRQTAELWEGLHRTDADSLYRAAVPSRHRGPAAYRRPDADALAGRPTPRQTGP